MKKHLFLGLLSLGCLLTTSCSLLDKVGLNRENKYQKREMRGAWLPTIYRNDYMGLSRAEGQKVLKDRIALLKSLNCNVVLFQVRAEGDAFYRSKTEPWSKYFTGEQGKSPIEDWDPLAFVIGECHKNGMELHAWINPYRGATNALAPRSSEHLSSKHPDWFVTYNKQLILDPGNPKGRTHLLRVAKELVEGYDIDALHLDDYFYPYPVEGLDFPDSISFREYGIPFGYTEETKGDWRRKNVNSFIRDLHDVVAYSKPWVRLGISPFGIYRNKASHPSGSQTKGLQNYDDLYADVLLWAKKGWVDYIAPQIYWNIGHPTADYLELAFWWNKALKKKKTQFFIGQDIKRTMDSNQLDEKMKLSQELSQGNIYWPADELVRNYKGIDEQLKNKYQPYPALLPEWRGILGKSPKPRPVDDAWFSTDDNNAVSLQWSHSDIEGPDQARFFALYIFPDGVKPSIKKVEYLKSISNDSSYELGNLPHGRYTILITAINRFWRESKPFSISIDI